METKFTKGEWILNENSYQIVSENDCSKNGDIDIIAQCYCGFNIENTAEEARANAKLIAAAPELLEACIKMVEACNQYNILEVVPEYEIMCDAIKKATEL